MRKTLAIVSSISLIALSLAGCISSDLGSGCEFGSGVPPKGDEKLVASTAVLLQVSEDFPSAERAIAQSEELSALFPSKEAEAPLEFSIVVADGAPRSVYKNWVSLERDKLETETDLKQKSIRAKNSIAKVYECLFDEAQPLGSLKDNVDLIAALDAAASTLSDSNSRHIFIFSNGLQTAGTPNMSKVFPESTQDVDQILDKLEEAQALPNLDGITVSWDGLGQQTDGRQALEQQSLNILRYFWQQLIARSGGTPPEEFGLASYGTEAPANAPASGPIAPIAKICLFTLGETSGFAFKPDSSEFLDRGLAVSGAEQIAAQILSSGCGDEELSVTGFTASGSSKEEFEKSGPDLELSRERAEAFAALLRERGINVTEVIGGGKGPIVDWDSNGKFVEELGKQNRIVRIEAVG